MDLNKRTLREKLGYLIPLAVAGLLNLLGTYPLASIIPISLGITSSLILAAVCLRWCIECRRRFPQKQMRNNMSLFAAAFILLSLLSHIKYSFVPPGGTPARYLWYAYYIPLTFGPLFMVYASLYIGKSDDHRISKKWYWGYLPAALISLGIMTNDLHQLAFRFPNGYTDAEHSYTYGVLYYLAAGWIVLTLLSVIALVIRSTFHRRLFKTAWLPLAVLIVGALYLVFYVHHGREWLFLQRMFQMNDFVCVISIALWESFVTARIIVPNSDYPAIFAVSSLNAGLADGDLQVRQVSAQGIHPRPEELRSAQNGETLLPGGDTLLKARAVTGGWFYWTEDLTELRRLREALDDTADFLEEENAMLRVSAQIEEGRQQTAEQNRLYDRVTDAVRPQLDTLDAMLQDMPDDEDAFRETMKTAGVLIAYVKRRCSLLLQADSRTAFTGAELTLCFEESAKALRMADVDCSLDIDSNVIVPAHIADRFYELFEIATERSLSVIKGVSVKLAGPLHNDLTLTIELTGADGFNVAEPVDLRALFDEISYSADGETTILCVTSKNCETAEGCA